MRKNDIQHALVPRLRFPEFREAPEWEQTTLTDICQVNPVHDGLPESFYYIDLESVEAGTLQNPQWIERANAPSRAQRLLRDGDILYQTVRPYQRNNLLFNFTDGEEYVASTGYAQLRARDSIGFLYQLIHTDSFVERVLAKCTGSSYPAINSTMLGSVAVWIPPTPAEQKKIADCLGSLDDLIAAEGRKLATLRDHKKGLMQQLFPREGETQPHLRFPEFRDAGEWNPRILRDFISERNELADASAPLFSLTIENGITAKTERYERSFLVAKQEGAYKLVQPNDFALNPMNLRFGAIARHSGSEVVSLSKYYNVFYCDESVDKRFCELYFQSSNMLTFFDRMATGSLIEKRRVHFEQFLGFDILFPSIDEQQRIADCLSSLDTLIAAQAEKFDALRTHKRGLMQRLFPSPDAVGV